MQTALLDGRRRILSVPHPPSVLCFLHSKPVVSAHGSRVVDLSGVHLSCPNKQTDIQILRCRVFAMQYYYQCYPKSFTQAPIHATIFIFNIFLFINKYFQPLRLGIHRDNSGCANRLPTLLPCRGPGVTEACAKAGRGLKAPE